MASRELHLTFEGWQAEPEVATLQAFFNSMHISKGDGEYALLGTVRLGAPDLRLDEEFMAAQRERLRQRSR